MESMGAELYIAADKFGIMEMKSESETYMLRHLSPHNCVVLVLHGYASNLETQTELIVKAVMFFRRFLNLIMSTEEWNALGKTDPAWLLEITKKVFDFKC
jgi:speckle-type POZ protein